MICGLSVVEMGLSRILATSIGCYAEVHRMGTYWRLLYKNDVSTQRVSLEDLSMPASLRKVEEDGDVVWFSNKKRGGANLKCVTSYCQRTRLYRVTTAER